MQVFAREKSEKRLAFLDATRGFMVLLMVPIHVLFFGMFFAFTSQGEAIFPLFPLPVDFSLPLGTGILLFFFITGTSLSVSMARRTGQQSFPIAWWRVIKRYGVYYLLSIPCELLIWVSFMGWKINYSYYLLLAVAGSMSFTQDIQGLCLAAILTFPLIFYFSKRKLVAVSLGFALAVSITLYLVLLPMSSALPQFSPLNPLLIGYFAALKGVPLIIAGAIVGKFAMEGRDVMKKIFPIGLAITMAYIVIPLFSSHFIPVLVPIWTYPHAILFALGFDLFLFGLFHYLVRRNTNVVLFQVPGRLSLFIYFGQFMLLLPIVEVIGGFGALSIQSLLGLGLLSEIVLLVFSYYFCKWRWGDPKGW